MIAYTMVGTRDLDRSQRFYDPLFAEMGQKVCFRDERCVSWGRESDVSAPRFTTGYPFDRNDAAAGNGVMTAFLVPDSGLIDKLYALALRHGGSREGEAGLRPQYGDGFYAAYVRDPDGNKLAFVSYGATAP